MDLPLEILALHRGIVSHRSDVSFLVYTFAHLDDLSWNAFRKIWQQLQFGRIHHSPTINFFPVEFTTEMVNVALYHATDAEADFGMRVGGIFALYALVATAPEKPDDPLFLDPVKRVAKVSARMWEVILATVNEAISRNMADFYQIVQWLVSHSAFVHVAVSAHDDGLGIVSRPPKRSKYNTQRTRDQLIEDAIDTVDAAEVEVEDISSSLKAYASKLKEEMPGLFAERRLNAINTFVTTVEHELEEHNHRVDLVSEARATDPDRKAYRGRIKNRLRHGAHQKQSQAAAPATAPRPPSAAAATGTAESTVLAPVPNAAVP